MSVVSLEAGGRVGSYEIVSLLGQGGMGEVYLCRDTILHRRVALKVLPHRDRMDEQRLGRFAREARVLAALNHPNIATLHGVESVDGVQALVMEYVEGETLADRLGAETPLGSGEALRIARQIVDALDAAHTQGIVHRDLKPDNIKLRPDGTVKVLDFGLAKAYEQSQQKLLPVFDTVTLERDGARAIVGTACYMSPEQTRGVEVDSRTDIWSFGCVLFEMVTQRRAFGGATFSDVIAGVLEREPDWSAVPASTPPGVRRVLRRCLEKDRNRRLRHIADARPELEQSPRADEETGHPHVHPRLTRVALALSALAVAAIIGFIIGTRGIAPSTQNGPTEFALLPPEGTAFGGGVTDRTPALAISPDGERVTFAATDRAGHRLLWVRPIRALAAEPLVGTDGAREPFWSPDGSTIGFFADGKLKTVSMRGGVPVTLADAENGSGGAWNQDGVILYAPSTQTGLYRVAASGGRSIPVTTIGRDEYGHVYPQFLPDGRHFIYLARGKPGRKGIYVAALDDRRATRLLDAHEKSRFAAPDRLLFLRDGRLLSQRFDPASLALSDEPMLVAESVGFIATDGRASYDVSNTGVLIYRASGLLAASQPIVVDHTGRTITNVGEPGDYQTASFSPDGSTVAAEKHDLRTGTGDLWLIDLMRGSSSRLTFDGMHNNKAVWSPDGKRIVFTGRPDGIRNLHLKSDLTSERDEPLLDPGPDRSPTDWSRDGTRILYQEGVAPRRDVWYLTLPERQPTAYLRGEFDEYEARFSPDGRYVAYVSNETGRAEIYVRAFPDARGKRQLSAGGGMAPRWSRDGRELFFVGPAHSVNVVSVRTEGSFSASVPRVLFTSDMRANEVSTLTADGWFDTIGSRFLIVPNAPGPQPPALPITVSLAWVRR